MVTADDKLSGHKTIIVQRFLFLYSQLKAVMFLPISGISKRKKNIFRYIGAVSRSFSKKKKLSVQSSYLQTISPNRISSVSLVRKYKQSNYLHVSCVDKCIQNSRYISRIHAHSISPYINMPKIRG